MWFLQIIRSFFFTIDSTLFGFIPTVYDLLIKISRTSILSQGQIQQFAGRIQMFLGVFMLFKVAFSIVTYIVNPDEFSDKSKGIAKLGKNSVIAMGLLIFTPYIFNLAFEFQALILEENTLATVIFGNSVCSEEDESECKSNSSYINSAGQEMAFTIMLPFFSPNLSASGDGYDLSSCVVLYDTSGKFNDKCTTQMAAALDVEVDESTIIQNYVHGVENHSTGLTFRLNTAKSAIKDYVFLIDYNIPITTVVAVVVLLLLITFCMDVAVRSVKLSFLQLISPVPIISFVDPKSGKDGLFAKWYKMCFSTYLSLFIRLISLYLGVYIISMVNGMYDNINGSLVTDPLVHVFIVIGILMFIKQLPKILEGLGVKIDGGGKFTMNPFKKFEEEAIGGKKILGAGKGLVTGAAVGTVGMLSGAGLARSLTGAVGGVRDGIQGKKFNEIRMNQVKRNADMRRARSLDSTFGGRVGAAVSSYFGGAGELGRALQTKAGYQAQIKRLDDQIKEQEDLKKGIQEQIAPVQRDIANRKAFADAVKAMEQRAIDEIKAGNGGAIGLEYLRREAEYERLKNSGTATDQQIADAKKSMNDYLNVEGKNEYMTQASDPTSGLSDATFNSLRGAAERSGLTVGVALANDGANIHSQMGAARGDISVLEGQIYNSQQRISDIDDTITGLQGQKSQYGDRMRDVENREAKAKADMDAVHGHPGGPMGGPGGFFRGPRGGGPRGGGPGGPRP